MKLVFSDHAWGDYIYWEKTDKKVLRRINTLIKETKRNPFEGAGKLEPLQHALSGYWSRRINDEHRFIYKVLTKAVSLPMLNEHVSKITQRPAGP